MDTFPSLFTFMALVLLLSQKALVNGAMEKDNARGVIGAIVDYSSRIGKEEKIAMEMAIEDLSLYKNQSFLLHIKNSQREPFRAALAATDLINTHQVQAILGPRDWEGAALVAEVGSKAQTPILSFADATPQWAIKKWPFLVQATPNQYAQVKAVAAIVQSFEWHQVTVIYEDIESGVTGIIPHLSDALQQAGSDTIQLVALPPFIASSLSKELQRLKQGQCRVFVVHLSMPLALHFFEMARKMEMMEKDYVWIVTDTIANLVHSINASTFSSSMQGIVGVKSYFSEIGHRFKDFYLQFCKRFSLEYTDEDNPEPGIYAVQAYDAIWTVALAMGESNIGGEQLLQKILLSDFDGLSTKVQFTGRKLSPSRIFQIINVMGKNYLELGFWSDGLGFSKTVDGRRGTYNFSMKNLGQQVFWPGGPLNVTPRGWAVPTSANSLRIGVPIGSIFKQFVNAVRDDQLENNFSFTGFSIDVFKATLERLPYNLPHKLFPFDGTYDALVEQVHLKKFDAVVGDVVIVAYRYEHAEFTQPYTEPGLVMVVPVRSKTGNRAWLFVKPFTKAMWVLIVVINVYNGFVLWLIERNHSTEFEGSMLNQLGTSLWLTFSTLFCLHGGKLHSNLSRAAIVVWLFVALVITQSYTANLTSMLTVQQLEPTVVDVESLKNSNAMVGYDKGSFLSRYLVDVLHFNSKNTKHFGSPEEYIQGFESKEIGAAFMDVLSSKLFLARHCKGFTTAGPTYNVGGYGFAFPRGSPLLHDMSKALLNVSESGKLYELEKTMTASEKCVNMELNNENYRLSPSSFWALFMISGGASTVALVIHVVIFQKWKLDETSMVEHKTIWRLMLAVMKHWGSRKRQFSRRVGDAESPRSSPNTWTLHV